MPRRVLIFYSSFKKETLAPPLQKNQILFHPPVKEGYLQKNSLLER